MSPAPAPRPKRPLGERAPGAAPAGASPSQSREKFRSPQPLEKGAGSASSISAGVQAGLLLAIRAFNKERRPARAYRCQMSERGGWPCSRPACAAPWRGVGGKGALAKIQEKASVARELESPVARVEQGAVVVAGHHDWAPAFRLDVCGRNLLSYLCLIADC